ncbi:MFS transporter [Ovoidimarina sediminis]|uniref:MFS transporter n=1 Tax=Ovoidimarina sediminis TaxID=3079856 RepID=UPI0029111292|nr:MFS transporter [Rhodophyticola sp. MJ-SS7]MDU8944842.1 MFS transporter [Rhodophyticola sp. MJ-SS7]
MFGILADRTFRTLFAAQVSALLGTGLMTVALGLLAYDLAGGDAALILGTIFTIKMIAYVGLSPIAAALVERLPRRTVLVSLDLVRAAAALVFPFVTEIWQAYFLVLVLQSASAAFTPAFQATIPDVLQEEDRYTNALSLSRLAQDLENIASPLIAAALLLVFSFDVLFFGTLAGFLASGLLILSVTFPTASPPERRGIWERTTRGILIYLATPRLRGLLALNAGAAAAGAMVLVNTVVLVRDTLGRDDSAVALTLSAFGAGSMVSALALPRMLERIGDRKVMVAGTLGQIGALSALAIWTIAIGLSWSALLVTWTVTGAAYAAALTPAGRLLRRSSHSEDRPAIFAAQFALSHACWLVTYPLAGWLMTVAGPVPALIALTAIAILGLVIALRLWPKSDSSLMPHTHDDLPPDHPHVRDGRHHVHEIRIDALHPSWPTKG